MQGYKEPYMQSQDSLLVTLFQRLDCFLPAEVPWISLWHNFHKLLETFLKSFVHIRVIASHSCCTLSTAHWWFHRIPKVLTCIEFCRGDFDTLSLTTSLRFFWVLCPDVLSCCKHLTIVTLWSLWYPPHYSTTTSLTQGHHRYKAGWIPAIMLCTQNSDPAI